MAIIDQPPGQPQPIAGKIAREGENAGGRIGPHRLAGRVVGAAPQDVSRSRLRKLFHHHDLTYLRHQIVFSLACLLQLRAHRAIRFVVAQQIMCEPAAFARRQFEAAG